MKTKLVFLLAIVAITTLSFTYAANKKSAVASKEVSGKQANSEPAGGFLSEDKF